MFPSPADKFRSELEEKDMGRRHVVPGTVCFLVLCACASTSEWVNIHNPKANFAQDHGLCEMAAIQDPKNPATNKFFLEKAIDRCMEKRGWVLREKR